MIKLKRVIGTCLLIVSMAAVSWVAAGETQGPNLVSLSPPPPETTADCTADCTAAETTQPDASIITTDMVNDLAIWLIGSIQ